MPVPQVTEQSPQAPQVPHTTGGGEGGGVGGGVGGGLGIGIGIGAGIDDHPHAAFTAGNPMKKFPKWAKKMPTIAATTAS